MGRLFGLRLGALVAALAVGWLVSVPSTAPSHYQELRPSSVISFDLPADPFYRAIMDLRMVAVSPAQSSSERIASRASTLMPAVASAAVRPTSIAGWRSGRVRTLATG